MVFKPLFICCAMVLLSCNNTATVPGPGNSIINPPGNPYENIKTIPLPGGFVRTTADSASFASWLRKIALKKDKTVYLFNGSPKKNQQAQFAVMDFSTGDKDLQQCADAVMRLRAEYLFSFKRFDEIVFYDNNKTGYHFSAPYTRAHFNDFLQRVFGMCGSMSLSKQLLPVPDFNQIAPGDVLIRGGFPGHAVIVTDAATDSNGKKIFMLAQGYMPAQDIHILINPLNEQESPWYDINEAEKIVTPEYVFYKTELKRWE